MSATSSDAKHGSPSVAQTRAGAPGVQSPEGIAGKTTEAGITSPATTRSTDLSKERKIPAQPRRPGGWIQFGADAGQLETAQAECDETGADHETFTACMQAKGWHSIHLTVEEPVDSD
jgi:hypothetical protein